MGGRELALPDAARPLFGFADELFTAGNRVVARLTWTGTHRGPLGDVAPTGNRVSYVGVGLFTVSGHLIERAWIVCDTQELWWALGRLGPGAQPS